LRAESVSPENRNDLFEAHLSIYRFFARYCARARVLDLGCGTGYGSWELAEAGARSVVGIDRDSRSLRYASKRFRRDGLEFRRADAQEFPESLGAFDAIVTSNLLEHLADPGRAVHWMARHLAPGGALVVAVPPVTDEATRALHDNNRFHVSPLMVGDWLALFLREGFGVTTFRHLSLRGLQPDFGSLRPAVVLAADYEFVACPPEDLIRWPTITALFECRALG
jgi:SAM-dependent methyltransferase